MFGILVLPVCSVKTHKNIAMIYYVIDICLQPAD